MLVDTAKAIVADGKGLLAMDESNATCDKRFDEIDIAQTQAMRCDWRGLLITTPDLGQYISGVILYDETFRQATADGTPLVKVLQDAGILVGIKVDIGAKALALHPTEKVTEGLDGLRERLRDYAAMGARFAKWRAVIDPAPGGASSPSEACLRANAHALGRYAALCQEAGLVPIVEPEVLMDGDHTQAHGREVTENLLRHVFAALTRQDVVLEAMILKPNMVVAGRTCAMQATVEEVADATVQCLRRAVPAAVSGIAFLSGGQSGAQACAHLNAMHTRFRTSSAGPLPWSLSFSFGRALQHPALEIWAGQEAHRHAAQRELLHRARCASAASSGQYDPAMEV
ncbi:class I fructose-bisphosphate aldolase [Acidovorax sp. A1169]|nr:class I fructose-bisphosphate aldolase [Acidovorax sp. A1169]